MHQPAVRELPDDIKRLRKRRSGADATKLSTRGLLVIPPLSAPNFLGGQGGSEMEDILKAIVTVLGVIALVFIIAALMALPTMLLWNWLMPVMFGFVKITWLQAWGLNFLCGTLFRTHVSTEKKK
jgi:hypothetical protein